MRLLQPESTGESEPSCLTDLESPFSEAEEMELASDLLGITREAELDHFLGGLIKGAGQAVGKFVRSPTGQALGGVLTGAAKQALPTIGSAIGGISEGRLAQGLAARLHPQRAGFTSKLSKPVSVLVLDFPWVTIKKGKAWELKNKDPDAKCEEPKEKAALVYPSPGNDIKGLTVLVLPLTALREGT
jgi:hypothetical protein